MTDYRAKYQRLYSTDHARDHGRPTIVPDDVERVGYDAPCGYCGEARGLCRHRKALAA